MKHLSLLKKLLFSFGCITFIGTAYQAAGYFKFTLAYFSGSVNYWANPNHPMANFIF